VPIFYGGLAPAERFGPVAAADVDGSRIPILVVEDSAETLHVYERLLRGSPFQVVPARTVREAEERQAAVPVRAIILDVQLAGGDTWAYLARLKGAEAATLPVLVVTNVDDQAKAASLGADAYAAQPVDRGWLLRRLGELTGTAAARAVIVDDEQAPRYALRVLLGQLGFQVTECGDPQDGLREIQRDPPDAVFLDLVMPGLTGLEILESLRRDERTRTVPTLVITSKVLGSTERSAIEAAGAGVVSKEVLGRADALAEVGASLRQAGWAGSLPASAAAPAGRR
jgi:CheY-like chemotaxis protein